MKKSIKLISLFIISLLMILIGKETVFAADNAPASFVAVSSKMTKNPTGLETNNISVKKTKTGVYIYCYDVNDLVPNNMTYTKKEKITDPIINYIVASGRQDKNENQFFATQAALWIHLLENGKMKDTQYNYINKIKTAMKNNPNNSIYKDINTILSKSKQYSDYIASNVEIESNGKSITFTLKNGYYVSKTIKVNKYDGDYEVILSNAPAGTTVETEDFGFIVKVPKSSVTNTTTNFNISVTSTKYNTYRYVSSNSKYQDMLVSYPEKTSDDISLTIKKVVVPTTPAKPKEPTIVIISKTDATTGKELSGATLVIKNSNGKVVEEWVSTNKPKEFDDLAVGTYTLEEAKAPEGYIKSTEVISFEVKKDNKTITKTIENEKKAPTVVKISKVDITNGEELPGATLVIKNSKGKVVEKWVSTNTPKTFDALEVGKYTLEETIAPKGYIKSTEVISFEVKNDGKIITKTMENKPEEIKETIVKIIKTDANDETKRLAGATLVVKDSKGNEKGKYTTDENGMWIIKDLEVGKYTVEELEAPTGYKKLENTITFEVKDNGEVIEVVVPNTKEVIEIVEVPDTGSFASNLTYIIGGLVIIIGSVLIYKNAKKEQ